MVTVVIAEKRSVAQAIASALGGGVERDGMIVCDGVRVTWAQGHLVELAEPGDYRDEWHAWSLEALPIDPDAWRWRVDPRAETRWDAVRTIVGASDVDALVNACDPDREGEAIFDRIVSRLGCRLPVRRLWVASLEADAIREAWTRMRAADEYRGLRDAADIRAKADWLIGMNASRAYTLVHGARMNIGRVQTPTLAMVVARDEAVEHHVPVPYWVAVAPMGGWRLESDRFDDRPAAQAAACAAAHGVRIVGVERRLVHERPPHLYDLTGLQKDMARMHGMSAAATLAAAQGLYERKLATYPRTDSSWVTHDDLPALEALLRSEVLMDRYAPAMRAMAARPELTVDDAKVSGHTAILPTMRAAEVDPAGLDEDMRLVLARVARRMFEAVADDRTRLRVSVTAEATGAHGGPVGFTAACGHVVDAGWSAIDPAAADGTDVDGDGDSRRDVIPQNLQSGVTLRPVGAPSVREGHTSPPKRFTEASLLSAMEHASRLLDDRSLRDALDDDSSHSGGIGTPATRADVIEKLLRCAYVERRGRTLVSTRAGRALVSVVDPQLCDVAYTARMERALADVEHGRADPVDVMAEFRSYALSIPALAQSTKQDGVAGSDGGRESFGPCPRCGTDVIRRGSVWTCASNRSTKDGDGRWHDTDGCGFRIWQTVAGVKLTDANVRALLSGRSVSQRGFTSKKGTKFDAALVLDADHGTRFEFGRHGRKAKA